MRTDTLNLKVGGKKVDFNLYSIMKRPSINNRYLRIYIINEMIKELQATLTVKDPLKKFLLENNNVN